MVVRGRIDYWVRMDIRVHSKSVSNWVVDSMGMEKLGGEQRGQQGGGKHVLIQDKGR